MATIVKLKSFSVYGPHKISPEIFKVCKSITKRSEAEFLKEHTELLKRIGCYVFAIRAGKGIRPWYVGKATKTFAQEIFTSKNCRTYNEVLADQGKGSPVMFFIARDEHKGATPRIAIDQIESYLILAAGQANPKLKNMQKRKKIEPWRIPGVVNSGKGNISESAKKFKVCLSV